MKLLEEKHPKIAEQSKQLVIHLVMLNSYS